MLDNKVLPGRVVTSAIVGVPAGVAHVLFEWVFVSDSDVRVRLLFPSHARLRYPEG